MRFTQAEYQAYLNKRAMSDFHVPKPKLVESKLSPFLIAWSVVAPENHPHFEAVAEYRAIPRRKFAFDFAWPKFKTALEIDGGIWIQGAHNTGTGKMRDLEKDWLAVQLGWQVIRWSPDMVTVDNCERLLGVLNRKQQMLDLMASIPKL